MPAPNETRFMRFVREDDPDGASTFRWRVKNKRHGDLLGMVEWYPGWRQFCFMAEPETIFSKDCLRDIADFCLLATEMKRK